MSRTQRRLRRALASLALFLAVLMSVSALSQTVWDAEHYLELVDRSDYLFGLASELPEDNADQRRDLLLESARLKEQAIDMLRTTLAAGELDAFGDRPRSNLLALYQNVGVLLAQLDLCSLAEAQLDRAREDESILPDLAIPALTGLLSEEIDSCYARIQQAQGVTEPDESHTVEDTVENTHEETDVSETAGDQASGDMDTPEAGPTEAVASDRDGPGVAPFVLIGVGVALTATALIYDSTLGDDWDEFSAIQSDCLNGSCDYNRGVELQGNLEDGRVVVACLLGAGVASALVGTILLLVSPDEDGPDVAWSPQLQPNRIGFVVSGGF